MPFRELKSYFQRIEVYSWDMTESSDTLQQMCHALQLPAECDAKAESRRREILAERILLRHIFGENTALLHNRDLAPLLSATHRRISIAHARGRLCIAVARDNEAFGIDLETPRPRVLNVRTAFLNDGEQQWIAPTDIASHLVAWTAKEAVFKAISDRALVTDYRGQIDLRPFSLNAHSALQAMEATSNHRPAIEPITTRYEAWFNERHYSLVTEISPGYIFTLATQLGNDDVVF